MTETPQRKQATKALPQIDPQVVAACKARNPNFGKARAAKSQPSSRPTPEPLSTALPAAGLASSPDSIPSSWGMPIALTLVSLLHAQDLTELNDLKAKIWEAEVAQRNFAAGLPHCGELNGTNFYFYPRNRVLNLDDYRRSLDNFVREGAINPENRRPWNKQDADARWAEVQKEATTDSWYEKSQA